MAANIAWGIDVGNRALKAVKLIRDGDQIRVDDFACIEHETVLSNAGDNRETLIQTALATFVQNHNIKGASVSVGVSGQSSFARFIKLPPVEPKKIPEIVRFEAIQQIPFPLDDVEWSYQLFQAPENPDVEVGIFAMRKELVSSHIKFFTDLDMNVQVVQMNPLAVYNAMHFENRFDGTTMIIDLGAENTDLIIADNETIWLRSIPIGGNSFTETLMKAFKLDFRKAEDLKRNAATSKYARQIFQAMRPVFADLVAEIQRSVGFYASVHRDSRIARILALGATFKLPGLQKYLQQNLALDVERLDTLSAAPSSDSKLAPAFNENVLSLISAYGLGLQAMGGAKVTSSLLPEKIRREKMWKEKTKWFGAAAAMFLLGSGIGFGSWFFQEASFAKSQSTEKPHNDQVLGEAKTKDSEWESLASSNSSERTIISNILSLQQYRSFWPKFIATVANTVPQARPDILREQPQLAGIDPAVIKQIPRGDRKMVIIDSMTCDYLHDATPAIDPKTDLRLFTSTSGATTPGVTAAPMGGALGGPMGMMGGPGGMPGGMPGMPGGGMPGAFGMPGAGMATPGAASPDAAPTGPATRGLLVTITCRTPFRSSAKENKYQNGVDFVQREFVDQLLKLHPSAQQPKMDFSVVRAQITSNSVIREDPNAIQAIKSAYQAALTAQTSQGAPSYQGETPYNPGGFPGDFEGRGGMMPGGMMPGGMMPGGGMPGFMPGGGGTNSGAPDESAAFMDRLTQEDVRDDWLITIRFIVLIDPPAFVKPAEETVAQVP